VTAACSLARRVAMTGNVFFRSRNERTCTLSRVTGHLWDSICPATSTNSRRCRPPQNANASLSNFARPCGLHSFDFQRSGCCTVYPRCTSDCHLCRFYRISRNIESITYVSSIGGRNSIPTAPTKNPADSVALALLNLPNKTIKQGVLVPRWSQLNWSQLASG